MCYSWEIKHTTEDFFSQDPSQSNPSTYHAIDSSCFFDINYILLHIMERERCFGPHDQTALLFFLEKFFSRTDNSNFFISVSNICKSFFTMNDFPARSFLNLVCYLLRNLMKSSLNQFKTNINVPLRWHKAKQLCREFVPIVNALGHDIFNYN